MGFGSGAGFVLIYIVILVVCLFVVRKSIRADQQKVWCPKCKTNVLASTSQTNKKANILLSVLTLGIWLIVWACTADLGTKGAPRCPVCREITQGAAERQAPNVNSKTDQDQKQSP